ncbi:hypothetical protein Xcc3_03790 [Xanthomonas campestris pv. campestris]|nr:hypothetical protein [Xanthomonas campestris]BBJ99071.1 hypothetical protein Xcc3_03790 [Xanthomonas campestris pv. campestris]
MALGKRPRRIVACDGSAAWPQAVPGWWRTVDSWRAQQQRRAAAASGRQRPQSTLQGRVTHQTLEERAWAR